MSLWTEVYRLQEALAYFPASDSVIYAPPEGHTINLDLCERLQLSPAVVSLLKRLPYPKDDWIAKEWPIIQECPAVVYTDENALFVTRDPEKAPIMVHKDEIRLDYLRPSELALTLGTADDAGTSIILDTDSNTIRFYEHCEAPPKPEEGQEDWREMPEDVFYYRNFPPQPAPEALKDIIKKFRDLVWIPKRSEKSGNKVIDQSWDENCNMYSEAKRILTKEFGWPDNFKKEEWGKERERVWWEIENRYL